MSLFQIGSFGVKGTHIAAPILGPVVSGDEDIYQHGQQAEPITVQASSPSSLRIPSSYQFPGVLDGDSSKKWVWYVYPWAHWTAGLVLKAQMLAALGTEAVVLVPTDEAIFIFV